MNDEKYERFIFDRAIEINDHIWRVIDELQEVSHQAENSQIRKFVDLSGHLHVEILRPIYKKYPELVERMENRDK